MHPSGNVFRGMTAAVVTVGLVAGLVVTEARAAEEFPRKQIELVVPSAPGGSNDTSTRYLAEQLKSTYGWSVIVVNKPGAQSLLAARYAASAAPDGHTLLSFGAANLAAPFFSKAWDVDLINDFAPVATLGELNTYLIANAQLPIRNQDELIAYAKANPGKLSYAGVISSVVLQARYLFQQLGVEILVVPYNGTGPGLQALLANTVQLMSAPYNPVKPLIEAGKLRAISFHGHGRSRVLPELPSLNEIRSDLVGVGNQTSGLSAPKNTPADVIAKLNKSINAVLDKPAVRERMETFGFDVRTGPPAAWQTAMQDFRSQMAEVAKAANLKPE